VQHRFLPKKEKKEANRKTSPVDLYFQRRSSSDSLPGESLNFNIGFQGGNRTHFLSKKGGLTIYILIIPESGSTGGLLFASPLLLLPFFLPLAEGMGGRGDIASLRKQRLPRKTSP